MQVVVNMGMRAILNVPLETRIETMLQDLNMLTISEEVYVSTMIFIYKVMSGLLPEYLSEMVIKFSDVHDYNTRHGHDAIIPLRKTEFLKKGIFDELHSYNMLLVGIKTQKSVETFRKALLVMMKEN